MRVVIGEDEVLLRQGLTHVLDHAGFEVVATAADATELVRRAREHKPDLVVTDIRMPPSHTDEGLVAAREVEGFAGEALVALAGSRRRSPSVMRAPSKKSARCTA